MEADKVMDYPKEGIVFRDITPPWQTVHESVKQLVDYARELQVDVIVGPEARGFIVGCPAAYEQRRLRPWKGKFTRPTKDGLRIGIWYRNFDHNEDIKNQANVSSSPMTSGNRDHRFYSPSWKKIR